MTPGAGTRSVVIHAHFYQPPREDPWLELVDREPSAAPFHDWNERIDHECYRAVLAARETDRDGAIRRIVNILEQISFNVGPTLLDWMERESPATYRGILAADRASATRLGHGNAIAMPYHHVILPLASHHDKRTEVRWGIADFRRRFGREPLGMWLPETAVDDDTLDVLAEEGIAFTVLAPHQVQGASRLGLPGRYRTGRGRTIALFAYDGAMSHDVAFGPLVRNSQAWIDRLVANRGPAPDLVSVATDGETFGHHHKFGDMALAATLSGLAPLEGVRVENFATLLARHPPTADVGLVAPSSWSCSHGVERWRSDCGCRMDPNTNQAWRAPLRAATEWLAEELHAVFDQEAPAFFSDAWAARTAYGNVGAPADVAVRGRELLELERNALRMFTSCGWFFDDVARIETRQILKYAARAIELAQGQASRLTEGFRERLALAVSNDTAEGTGADLFDRIARPRWPAEARAAAGFATTAALAPDRSRPVVGAFLVGRLGENLIQTQHRRTGRTDRFATEVHRTPGFGLEVELVWSEGQRTLDVPLEAFPERERDVAREALRREALREVLTPEELVRLAHGSIDYAKALREAVVRLIPERAADFGGAGAGRLVRALDLLRLEGLSVPFDAQTRFYRLVRNGAVPAALRQLAGRLGFAPDVFGRTAD
ncbi:MAG: DUF3536 domain-containing protein [Gemmatimonadales bacterium]